MSFREIKLGTFERLKCFFFRGIEHDIFVELKCNVFGKWKNWTVQFLKNWILLFLRQNHVHKKNCKSKPKKKVNQSTPEVLPTLTGFVMRYNQPASYWSSYLWKWSPNWFEKYFPLDKKFDSVTIKSFQMLERNR